MNLLLDTLKQLAIELKQGGTVNAPGLGADEVLRNGLNIVYFIAGIIAIITIIVGGIMYSSSHGNSTTITNAKNLIIFAVVGLGIVLSAFAITNFVIGGLS